MTDNKHLRGFASMSAERRTEIARLGGRAVPAEKRSFSTNSALAVEAGRRGGTASSAARPSRPE